MTANKLCESAVPLLVSAALQNRLALASEPSWDVIHSFFLGKFRADDAPYVFEGDANSLPALSCVEKPGAVILHQWIPSDYVVLEFKVHDLRFIVQACRFPRVNGIFVHPYVFEGPSSTWVTGYGIGLIRPDANTGLSVDFIDLSGDSEQRQWSQARQVRVDLASTMLISVFGALALGICEARDVPKTVNLSSLKARDILNPAPSVHAVSFRVPSSPGTSAS